MKEADFPAGRLLAAARVLAGLTQQELADEAGLSDRAIRYWEARGFLPTVDCTRAAIFDALARHGARIVLQPSPAIRWLPPGGNFNTNTRGRARGQRNQSACAREACPEIPPQSH